jgi:quercetin 2,3-dioxygenase
MISYFPASSRGQSDIDWLSARFTYSFANYYNPKRMGFGALRVINDDVIAAHSGFGMHSHENVEIITIVLEGELTHTDSMGNTGVIRAGDIQLMSAGTGVRHSEVNAGDIPVKSLQIWIFPHTQGVRPRYAQSSYTLSTGVWTELISWVERGAQVTSDSTAMTIYQNASICMGDFVVGWVPGLLGEVSMLSKWFWVHLMVLEGKFAIGDTMLHPRDAVEITEILPQIVCHEAGRLLVFAVPL